MSDGQWKSILCRLKTPEQNSNTCRQTHFLKAWGCTLHHSKSSSSFWLLIPCSRLLFSLPLPKLSLLLSLLPLLPPLHLLPFPPSSSYQMGAHIPLPASVQDSECTCCVEFLAEHYCEKPSDRIACAPLWLIAAVLLSCLRVPCFLHLLEAISLPGTCQTLVCPCGCGWLLDRASGRA
jgi:hypothetical protein